MFRHTDSDLSLHCFQRQLLELASLSLVQNLLEVLRRQNAVDARGEEDIVGRGVDLD